MGDLKSDIVTFATTNDDRAAFNIMFRVALSFDFYSYMYVRRLYLMCTIKVNFGMKYFTIWLNNVI